MEQLVEQTPQIDKTEKSKRLKYKKNSESVDLDDPDYILTIRHIYPIARNLYLQDIKRLEEKIYNYQRSKAYVLTKIERDKDKILNYDNISIESITKLTYVNFAPQTEQRFINLCQTLAKLNTNTTYNLNKIERIKEDIATLFRDEDRFVKLLKLWNKSIRKEIVKGYSIYFGYNVGEIYLRRVFTKPDTGLLDGNVTGNSFINWKESKIKKDEILARGGTLYEVIRDEKGVKIGDNGGEKYLVIQPQLERYYVSWKKTPSSRITNYQIYTFEPYERWIKEYMKDINNDTSLVNNLKTVD